MAIIQVLSKEEIAGCNPGRDLITAQNNEKIQNLILFTRRLHERRNQYLIGYWSICQFSFNPPEASTIIIMDIMDYIMNCKLLPLGKNIVPIHGKISLQT